MLNRLAIPDWRNPTLLAKFGERISTNDIAGDIRIKPAWRFNIFNIHGHPPNRAT